MSYNHGKDANVFVDGYDFSGYLSSAEMSSDIDVSETTTFMHQSKTYILGTSGSTLTMDGYFDDQATADNIMNSAFSSNESILSYYPSGSALGRPGYAFVGVQSSFSVSASVTDNVSFSVAVSSSAGVFRTQSLIAMSTLTSSDEGDSLDNGAGSTYGGYGFLHAANISGTITVKIQHSTNNSSWTDLATFSSITSEGSELVSIVGTVNRYARVLYTISSGGSVDLQVGLNRL